MSACHGRARCDVVIYGKFGGNEVKVDGKTYLLMRADDIYAVVE